MDENEKRIRALIKENPRISLQHIGDEFGVSRERARQFLKKYNIKKQHAGSAEYAPKVCEFPSCETTFEYSVRRKIVQKFCGVHKKEGVVLFLRARYKEKLAEKMALGKKVCTRCDKELPFSSFFPRKTAIGSDTFFSYCRNCIREYTEDWQRRNPEKTKEIGKRAMTKYLLTHREDVYRNANERYHANIEESRRKAREYYKRKKNNI